MEQLEFDFEFVCPFIEAEYYREGAQDLIRKLLPAEMLIPSGHPAMMRARLADLLPVIRWSNLEKAPCSLSVLLLCKYRLNACTFFCEMVSRWLAPGRQFNVELFFSSDVRLPHLSDDLLTVAEVVVYLKSASEMEEVRRNLQSVETEIRLGIVSNYHARRILEFKGLSTDGKTAMIQEKISSLIQSHSKDFDRGIFSQMQQFLVNCSEEFKKIRDYHHISRMISNLYSLRKLLKQNVEVFPNKRHVILKFLKTRLTQAKGNKPVLGILAGLNFLREHEVFEESHIATSVQELLPLARLVAGSCIVDPIREDALKTVYLEMEKVDGTEFSLHEIQRLKTELEGALKERIEQLTRPIYMPRNEEEVLRNIMALSLQIRTPRDPSQGAQVVITFEETRGSDLYFTVILVRACGEEDPSVQELIARSKMELKYIPDRIRKLGMLKGKVAKEATVFRTFVSSAKFLRSDHSVDLYQARAAIFSQLNTALGPLRDYNGGMMLKQNEQISALRAALKKSGASQPLLLEKFFHALMPMEMRTSCEIEPMKQLFLLLLSSMKSEGGRLPFAGSDFFYKQDAFKLLAVVPKKWGLPQGIESLKLPTHQFANFVLEWGGTSYLGIMLLSGEKDLQDAVLNHLQNHLS